MTLLDWLKERKENCDRIGAHKSDEDLAGWKEDSRYFQQAIDKLRDIGTDTSPMEHYRCFHCKRIFGPEMAESHFGKHTTDLPECIRLVKTGAGGGPHDAYIRLRWDEYERMQEEIGNLRRVFDMQQTRMGAATALWRQAGPDRELTLPDLGDLLQWLMDRAARYRSTILRNRKGYRNILEVRKIGGETGRYGALTREEIEQVIAEIDSALTEPVSLE